MFKSIEIHTFFCFISMDSSFLQNRQKNGSISIWTLLFSTQIYTSRKWGFTKWNKVDFEEMRKDGKLITDGVGAQYRPDHGPLADWKHRVASM